MCRRTPFEVRRFDELDSTNSYLLGQARLGAPGGLVAVAAHQRAGRGRLGRRWEAPPASSLLLSVLLRPVLEPDEWQLATAAVALAAADACGRLGPVHATIKWPNDLVVGSRKLAGVLGEADPGAPGGPPGTTALVVGIGLNVRWPGPPGAGGTCLQEEAGRPIEVRTVEEELLDQLVPWLERLSTPQGRPEISAALRDRSSTLGQLVRVTLAGSEILGRAVELTPGGHLVVETDAGRVVVAAGDVVHLRATGA